MYCQAGDVRRWSVVVGAGAPGVPVAVHLVVETDDHRQVGPDDVTCVLVQVVVEVTGQDLAEAVVAVGLGVTGQCGLRHPRDHGQRAAVPGRGDLGGVVGRVEAAEELHRARRLPGGLGHGGEHRRVAGQAVLGDAEVVLRRGEQFGLGGRAGRRRDVGVHRSRGRPGRVDGQPRAGDAVTVVRTGGGVEAPGIGQVGQVGRLGILLPLELVAVLGAVLGGRRAGRLRGGRRGRRRGGGARHVRGARDVGRAVDGRTGDRRRRRRGR